MTRLLIRRGIAAVQEDNGKPISAAPLTWDDYRKLGTRHMNALLNLVRRFHSQDPVGGHAMAVAYSLDLQSLAEQVAPKPRRLRQRPKSAR